MPDLMRGSFKTRSQVKLWAHLVALTLAICVTSIAVARMFITNSQRRAAAANSVTGNGGQRSMSGQIALSMAAKSIFFITYQLMADHKVYFKERPRVNMVLNLIEAVAWPAVVAFTVQGILKKCTGTNCILSWIIVPLAVVMSLVSALAAFISIGDWQYFRKIGLKPSETREETDEVKLESAQVRTIDIDPKVSRPKESRTRDSGNRDHSSRDTRDSRPFR
ncbi:hypothetical protein ONS95_012381 [Cadophora gregata]|uniref:uncharacterized protein n=1 Tax=Cadophora gregata TaxID=51156 RepID=UPI0026DC2F09|nr:uncharacterized protein ONS95_012381 [Cadophora gregata]KAK0118073.1 hypothetical protein ONS95_012381 [Cadophora gregata]KAK0123141.1 hypothetical protein ONS96_010145 [Cadophora gregata f. sp. sojae]